MKKYLEIAAGVMSTLVVATVSVPAHAGVTVCAGGVAASGTAVTANSNFVQVTFTPKCSNNVYLSYSEGTVAFGVASGSKKGKTYFSGNTSGGGVSPVSGTAGVCPAAGCDAGTVNTNADSALTAATSS